jgi:hypothetical protein
MTGLHGVRLIFSLGSTLSSSFLFLPDITPLQSFQVSFLWLVPPPSCKSASHTGVPYWKGTLFRLAGFPLESIIPLDVPTVIVADDALDSRTGLAETHTLGVFFLYSFCHDLALKMSLAWINDLTDYALLFAIWMRSCCIRFTLDTALGWKRKGSHPLPGGLGVVSHCHGLAVRIRPQGSILFSVPGSGWFLRFSSNVFGSRILRCDPSLRRGVY